jgi:GT2 family glycosyltransferase
MMEALAAGVDYVVIVAQDTHLEPDVVQALVDVAEAQATAGAQPKLLRREPDGRVVVHSRGNELHYLGVGSWRATVIPTARSPCGQSPTRAAPWCSTGPARSEVGTFDPALYTYHEDSDLGWRLRLAVWEALLTPDAAVHHDYDFARPAWKRKWYYVDRNRLVNVLIHHRAATLAVLAPALLAFDPVGLVYAARSGWLGERLDVYEFFMRPASWRYLAAKRRGADAAAATRPRVRAVPLRPVRLRAGGHPRGALAPRLESFAAYWSVVRRLLASWWMTALGRVRLPVYQRSPTAFVRSSITGVALRQACERA